MSLYINGEITCNKSKAYNLSVVNRAFNYIGKSFDAYDGYSSSIIDDLRFYNKCLTQTEILELKNETGNVYNHNLRHGGPTFIGSLSGGEFS